MSISPSVPFLVSRKQRTAVVQHGLYLVPGTHRKTASSRARSNFIYKIATIGAALFLAMTVC